MTIWDITLKNITLNKNRQYMINYIIEAKLYDFKIDDDYFINMFNENYYETNLFKMNNEQLQKIINK